MGGMNVAATLNQPSRARNMRAGMSRLVRDVALIGEVRVAEVARPIMTR